jgi:hypothetical protein
MAVKSKKRKKRFKGAVSRNAAKQSRGAQYGHLNLPKGISVFKEEPGSRVSLDIMPYEVTIPNHPDRDDEYGIALPGELWYKRPYFIHRNIGPENQSVVCPTSIGQKCPICEHRAQLLKEGADWNDDAVKALKPQMRNLYVVIPKGSKKFEEKPHIWDISQFLFQDKLNEEIQENEEFESFPDLEEGFTLRIRFSEESFGSNKYAETSRIDFKERDRPYKESILDEIPHLDDVLVIPSYKEVEAIFFGKLDEDDPSQEDDEEAKTPKRAAKPTRYSNFKEDDEDEDDEDEDDEDDALKQKPRRNQKAEPDDEEEEEESEDGDLDSAEDSEDDEDDEDEEEEEKAQVRRRSSSKKAKKGKGKCPYGHKFGADNDEYDECMDCEMWDECMEASEGDA